MAQHHTHAGHVQKNSVLPHLAVHAGKSFPGELGSAFRCSLVWRYNSCFCAGSALQCACRRTGTLFHSSAALSRRVRAVLPHRHRNAVSCGKPGQPFLSDLIQLPGSKSRRQAVGEVGGQLPHRNTNRSGARWAGAMTPQSRRGAFGQLVDHTARKQIPLRPSFRRNLTRAPGAPPSNHPECPVRA